MAEDELPDSLYLQSLKSATATQPRFSDVSRPSDGTIQVDRLKLTPAQTGHDEEVTFKKSIHSSIHSDRKHLKQTPKSTGPKTHFIYDTSINYITHYTKIK